MSQTILVTGASSFIGAHVIQLLLNKGYNVRGTVRSKAKEASVLEGIPENQRNQVSFAYIADIATDSADEAVQGVQGIIHVASPFHFKITNAEKDMLIPAINGTESILKAAHKYNSAQTDETKQIKRIVITSSAAAVTDPSQGLRPGYSYTEKDWAPFTYEQAAVAHDNPILAYCASKLLAEKAAWNFIEKEKPTFTIATMCEPFVFGPRVNGFKTFDDLNTSNNNVWTLVTSGKDGTIPTTRVPWEIDVRDVAFAHVAALENQTETNERYLIAAESYSYQQIADIVRESTRIPASIKETTPIGTPGQWITDHFQLDSTKAQTQLGVKYIPLKQTIEDLILQLVELQQQKQ